MMRLVLLAALCVPASSQTAWKVSAAALVAAHTADTVTSLRDEGHPGWHETGALYGAHFTRRDIGAKVGIVGAQVIVQYLLLRHHPRLAAWFVLANAGQSAAVGAVAWRNTRLR